jgi:uncharacterized protein involved in response to NO
MTHAIFAAVLVAALVRICAAFETSQAMLLLQIAGAAWILAFFAFAISYCPLLVRPRDCSL